MLLRGMDKEYMRVYSITYLCTLIIVRFSLITSYSYTVASCNHDVTINVNKFYKK